MSTERRHSKQKTYRQTRAKMAETANAIRQLEKVQRTEKLALVQLHDSIRPDENKEDQKRNSGVSDASTADEIENATPTSLQAELMHYKVM
jgi:hypothetical protein